MTKFGVPMKMVKTATIVVEAEDEESAAEKLTTPRSQAIEQKLDEHDDWQFEDYETDFSWGIEAVDDGE